MKSVLQYLWLPVLMVVSLGVQAQPVGAKQQMRSISIDDYIQRYTPIAVEEMKKLGIPASITLAQGILESNFGNSELALKANNHFGIKCHNDWRGKGYYMDDDAKNECFRVYATPEESYVDHSNFLKSRSNYAELFKLDPKDYKSWAKGLKNAGYATNPQYANLLIRIIEDHKLYDLDSQGSTTPTTLKDAVAQYDNKIFEFNNIKTVVVQPNQTIDDIAREYNVKRSRLMDYNDLNEGDSLVMGSKIYLQPKRFSGFEKVHEVKKGETMRSISQKEGIKLWSLYRKNHMEWGQEPEIGSMLCLKQRCANPPKLKDDSMIRQQIREDIDAHSKKVREEYMRQREDSLAKLDTATAVVANVATPNTTVTPTTTTKQPAPATNDNALMPKQPIHTIPIDNPGDTLPLVIKDNGLSASVIVLHPEGVDTPIYHLVKARETLFGLAKQYYTTVDSLKKWNGLDNTPITEDMDLIVGFGKIPEPPKIEMINEPNPEVPAQPDAFSQFHIVKPGESLFSIAKLYNVTTEQLKKWNSLKAETVSVGQKLIVYDNSKQANTDKVPLEEEIANNKKDKAPIYHEVVHGETLFGISKQYGVSVDDLKKWNDLSQGLKSGMKLVVSYNVQQNNTDEGTPRYHIVEPKETLYSVARTFGVTVQQLKEWNKLTDLGLKIGQKLIVGY